VRGAAGTTEVATEESKVAGDVAGGEVLLEEASPTSLPIGVRGGGLLLLLSLPLFPDAVEAGATFEAEVGTEGSLDAAAAAAEEEEEEEEAGWEEDNNLLTRTAAPGIGPPLLVALLRGAAAGGTRGAEPPAVPGSVQCVPRDTMQLWRHVHG